MGRWTDAMRATGTENETVSLASETLRALRDEAAAAGDEAMVALCDAADAGSLSATRRIIRALAAAEAMGD